MFEFLGINDQKILLNIARSSIINHLAGVSQEPILLSNYSENLQALGASFVTLTTFASHRLRGCIGALEAYQPLILDVRQHAISAATEDYRFRPIDLAEMDRIRIEISRLTPTQKLEYDNGEELLLKLFPGKDGVVLSDGYHRATFLPQVWEKVGTTESFLGQLCLKMGVDYDLWRKKKLDVSTYQVQEFSE